VSANRASAPFSPGRMTYTESRGPPNQVHTRSRRGDSPSGKPPGKAIITAGGRNLHRFGQSSAGLSYGGTKRDGAAAMRAGLRWPTGAMWIRDRSGGPRHLRARAGRSGRSRPGDFFALASDNDPAARSTSERKGKQGRTGRRPSWRWRSSPMEGLLVLTGIAAPRGPIGGPPTILELKRAHVTPTSKGLTQRRRHGGGADRRAGHHRDFRFRSSQPRRYVLLAPRKPGAHGVGRQAGTR